MRGQSIWEKNAGLFRIVDVMVDDYSSLFEEMLETRPQMQDRLAVIATIVDAVLRIQSPEEKEMDWLERDEFDDYDRAVGWFLDQSFPLILLEHHRDQDCYDFMKWWHTPTLHGEYTGLNMVLPYLEIKDANAFEPWDNFTSENPGIGQVTAVALLKIRLMMDLHTNQKLFESAAKNLPRELFDMIQRMALGSAILARPDIMGCPDQSSRMDDLKAQVLQLYNCAKRSCSVFWRALAYPEEYVIYGHYYIIGIPDTDEETQQVARYAVRAWMETPGAIRLIRGLIERDMESG